MELNKQNIITMIHLVLMQQIDGPSAQLFEIHIGKYAPELIHEITESSELKQIQWSNSYWLRQLAHDSWTFPDGFLQALEQPTTLTEYIGVFTSLLIPNIECRELPYVDLPPI